MGSTSRRSINQVGVAELVEAGLDIQEAEIVDGGIKAAISHIAAANRSASTDLWRELTARRLLKPSYPHSVHQLVYYAVYANYDDASDNDPPLHWFPSLDESKNTNLGRLMEARGPKLLGASYKDPITIFSSFQKFTAQHPDVYWSIVLNELSVRFRDPPKSILDTSDKSKHGGTWLPGSVLNAADCCLLSTNHPSKPDSYSAIVWSDENGDNSRVNHMTLGELRQKWPVCQENHSTIQLTYY